MIKNGGFIDPGWTLLFGRVKICGKQPYTPKYGNGSWRNHWHCSDQRHWSKGISLTVVGSANRDGFVNQKNHQLVDGKLFSKPPTILHYSHCCIVALSLGAGFPPSTASLQSLPNVKRAITHPNVAFDCADDIRYPKQVGFSYISRSQKKIRILIQQTI